MIVTTGRLRKHRATFKQKGLTIQTQDIHLFDITEMYHIICIECAITRLQIPISCPGFLSRD